MFTQLLKYGFVGAISTLIHISIAFLYIYFVNNDVFLSNIIAFIFAFIFSYTVQSLFVFEHKLELIKTLKYFFVQLFALLSAYYLSNIINIENPYFHTLAISFILPLLTFFIHKFWTFKFNNPKEETYASE